MTWRRLFFLFDWFLDVSDTINSVCEFKEMCLCCFVRKKVNQSHYRPEASGGFQEVKVPRLRDSGPGWC